MVVVAVVAVVVAVVVALVVRDDGEKGNGDVAVPAASPSASSGERTTAPTSSSPSSSPSPSDTATSASSHTVTASASPSVTMLPTAGPGVDTTSSRAQIFLKVVRDRYPAYASTPDEQLVGYGNHACNERRRGRTMADVYNEPSPYGWPQIDRAYITGASTALCPDVPVS